MTVDANVAGERTQLDARGDEVYAERHVGRGQPVGGARANRDVAVVQARLQLRDAEARERTANRIDALIERGAADPRRQCTQPRAPALKPLRVRRAWIGAEVGDLELEALDVDR